MAELRTNYMGLDLRNPLVASASPLSENIEKLRALEDAGIGAVVMYSLFEEQIELEQHSLDLHLSHSEDSYHEALSYFPELSTYHLGPSRYLDHLHKVKQALRVPVIGSLNGMSPGGWVSYAQRMEEAGADGLELNIYHLPTDPSLTGQQVEDEYVELVRQVRLNVSIPLAVKLSPFFSAPANIAAKLDAAGANALVLFNRFYQPDLDIENLTVTPGLELSTPGELRLRLRWAAILYGNINCDIAITGGIHAGTDLVKALMSGASVGMMTSALLRHGPRHAAVALREFHQWLDDHEYVSVNQMIGSMSQRNVADPAAFERANYLKVLGSYTQQA